MPVKIRLKRMGSKKRPFYRLIAADSRMPRDGRFIETLGHYNPVANPAELKVHEDRVFKWFERGAVPTESAASLLRQVGALQKWELMKQGLTGDALENRVEAIKAQRLDALARKDKKKQGQLSAKAKAKAEAEAEKAEAEADAGAKAEAAESSEASGAEEAPAEAADADKDAGEEKTES